MKFKHTLLLFPLFLFSLTLPLYAQPDAKAQGILQKTSATYKAMKSIEAQFTYTLDNETAKVHDSHSGKLLLQGAQFKINIFGQQVQSDGTTVWTVMDEAKEVHIKTSADFKEETDLDPTTIFTSYDKGFKHKYIEETTIKGKKAHVIDLFPEDPGKKPFSRIRLTIDVATSQIVSSRSFSKDGSTFTIDVTAQKANVTVAPDAFKTDVAALKAKGMEVVDLR